MSREETERRERYQAATTADAAMAVADTEIQRAVDGLTKDWNSEVDLLSNQIARLRDELREARKS